MTAWHSTRFAHFYTPEEASAKAEYYNRARALLHDKTLWRGAGTAGHKKVWALHSEGDSIRKIAKETGLNRNVVYAIIKKYVGRIK